jgi:hypothetical protein
LLPRQNQTVDHEGDEDFHEENEENLIASRAFFVFFVLQFFVLNALELAAPCYGA